MDTLSFNYKDSCLLTTQELSNLDKILNPEISRISQAHDTHYSTDYASVNLPFDTELIDTIIETVKEKKIFSPTTLVVIGIGGSSLGTIAVLQALRGKFYNDHHVINVYFIDTVDTDHIQDIAELVEHDLETGNNIILNVISKSGTTTETIANFEIFLEILKNHRPYNYHNFIVATTDKDSLLWELAQKEKFTTLAIPDNVGGRYSVFSAVGLFPLCFLDIDIIELIRGAQDGFTLSTSQTIHENHAALSAIILFTHYQQNLIIHDSFIFSVALEGLGAWYRQLSAESLGKAYNNNNELINTGILPTISIGSSDLHSVAQLYLAGPHNRFTTFITIYTHKSQANIPNYPLFEPLVPHIQNKSLADIMNAIIQGTFNAYKNDNRPFISIVLPEKSAYHIGQLMQIKMIEVIYLGFLLNINPFNQPAVELYKKETKKILSQLPATELKSDSYKK